MCVNVVLVSVTIALHQWLMRPGLMGDTWAFPDFDWYGTTEPSTGPWFMVRRFFLYPLSHRISPKYINSLAAHLAMCLSTLADPLSLRGLFLYFRTLKLPKVTCPCTNTWLNNRSQRWTEIFVGTLHIKATDTYVQMSSVVCARIKKRHLGILGRGGSGLPPVIHWLFLLIPPTRLKGANVTISHSFVYLHNICKDTPRQSLNLSFVSTFIHF